MKNKIIDMIIFLISVVSLAISLYLFYNMGIFVDEHNTTPAAVCGGTLGLIADWCRLFLLFALSVLSGIKLFKKNRGVNDKK